MTTIEHSKGEGAPVPEALAGGNHRANIVGYHAGSSRARNRRSPTNSLPSGAPGTTSPGSPSSERDRATGVEVRVHGIGDHATYSALGTPNYKELVDSRVWIGAVAQPARAQAQAGELEPGEPADHSPSELVSRVSVHAAQRRWLHGA